jgi:Sulfotransferase domain
MISFLRYLNRNPQESRAPSAETTSELRKIMQGYRSTVDAPICDLIPELVAAYPDAKFILTTRDSEAIWWRSWRESVGIFFEIETWRTTLYRSLIFPVRFLRRMDVMTQEVNKRLRRDWGSIGPHVYSQHNQRVRELVPKNRLLEYNVKEGWEPLCKYLGVEVPDQPFPRLNEGDSAKAIFVGHQLFGAFCWAAYLGLAGGAVYLVMHPHQVRGSLTGSWSWVRDTLAIWAS